MARGSAAVPKKVTGLWFKVGEIPFPLFIFLFLLVATWFMLTRSYFGRSIFAIGGNRVAAQRMGFNETKITLGVFACAGFLMGVAAFLMLGINASAQPSSNSGYEMTIISAVILGRRGHQGRTRVGV